MYDAVTHNKKIMHAQHCKCFLFMFRFLTVTGSSTILPTNQSIRTFVGLIFEKADLSQICVKFFVQAYLE